MTGGSSNKIEPTEDQKAQQQVNAELWNYYIESYKPLVDRYAQSASSPAMQDMERKKVAGQINADVMKSAKNIPATDNPVATTKQLTMVGDVKRQAEQAGEAGVKSNQIADVQNVIDIGRGQATEANRQLGEISSQSVVEAIRDKELSMQEDAATQNAVGSLVGAGLGAYKGYKAGKENEELLTMLRGG